MSDKMSDKLQFVDDPRQKSLSSAGDKLKSKGLHDLALTTNGYFLPDRAQGLKAAGLDRITISLDSLKRDVFKQMTGVDVFDRVLAGSTPAEGGRVPPIKKHTVSFAGV